MKISLQSVLLCLGLIHAVSAWAMTYSNGINETSWRVDTSVFECRLEHSVPYYGKAIFRTRAGEKSMFMLDADTSRLASGKAALMFTPPVWRHADNDEDYGYVPVTRGKQPITLNATYAERMLSELFAGKDVLFTREPWYGANESSSVRVSTIGFRYVYREYLDCLSGLLPVNYDQIRRTAVYFGSAIYELSSKAEIRKLDQIVQYVKADNNVKEFYIDGHTDTFGMRKDNLELSEKRAKFVSDYLISKGIPEDAIIVRWHGERYPTSKNASKNRRVTIRLERAINGS